MLKLYDGKKIFETSEFVESSELKENLYELRNWCICTEHGTAYARKMFQQNEKVFFNTNIREIHNKIYFENRVPNNLIATISKCTRSTHTDWHNSTRILGILLFFS